jgi:hypothetical protein
MWISEMRSNRGIYDSLVKAGDLKGAVDALSDHELRQVRGALARGDYDEWPGERVHGVCILVACERFMNPVLCTERVPSDQSAVISGKAEAEVKNPSGCERCHGHEMTAFHGAGYEKTEVIQ